MIRSFPFPLAMVAFIAVASYACVDQDANDSLVAPRFSAHVDRGSVPEVSTVYTQNMWLGGDTGPLFSLPLTDPSRIGEVIAATATFYGQVQASDIPARAAAVADEIDAQRPHIVGLQEAVGYATGILNPLDFSFVPTAPGPDLLGSLLAEVATRGLPYSLAVMQPGTSIALPIGPPNPDFTFPALGVQDRVAILVRNDQEVMDFASGLYTARIPLGPAEVVRGWARVTLEHDGAMKHFVVTHLETQGSGPSDPIRLVHNGQAFELQHAVLAPLQGEVVLMGDLNSDANADPSARSWTPTYGNLVDAGFIDIWNRAPHAGNDEGMTCCFELGRTLDERIDFVLLRQDASSDAGDSGLHRGFYRADIVGEAPDDQVAPGLWPSDHAGIVADLRDPSIMR